MGGFKSNGQAIGVLLAGLLIALTPSMAFSQQPKDTAFRSIQIKTPNISTLFEFLQEDILLEHGIEVACYSTTNVSHPAATYVTIRRKKDTSAPLTILNDTPINTRSKYLAEVELKHLESIIYIEPSSTATAIYGISGSCGVLIIHMNEGKWRRIRKKGKRDDLFFTFKSLKSTSSFIRE